MNRSELADRTRAVAHQLLHEKGFVSAVDVLLSAGRLSKEDHERWRFRQVQHLEAVLPGSLNQHAFFLRELRAWARALDLKPSRTAYVSWGKGPKQRLRFSKYGRPHLEESFSTHYVRKAPDKARSTEPDSIPRP